jgi:hypothetical protein
VKARKWRRIWPARAEARSFASLDGARPAVLRTGRWNHPRRPSRQNALSRIGLPPNAVGDLRAAGDRSRKSIAERRHAARQRAHATVQLRGEVQRARREFRLLPAVIEQIFACESFSCAEWKRASGKRSERSVALTFMQVRNASVPSVGGGQRAGGVDLLLVRSHVRAARFDGMCYRECT